ncbi:hypothetical protein [Geminocystis sp. GBBB08]|uniref:hypothetical protein n=1 Tax=Geminocystis sp. GBBB08 TaxID=2604140 RepID=UPI0027E33058|nr:hypothetical protein [Geminocystis sp. GBBB08]MBL1211609.1 hypothetical protein [Geminocystis sp. GBBB08]
MPSKNSFNNIKKETSWLDTNILFALSIFLSTYTVLGWAIANIVERWANIINEESIAIHLLIQENILLLIIRLLILAVTVLVSLILSSPLSVITFLFEKSINSDLKAFLAIFLWSIILVFIFCSIDYFADLLLIISTNILLRLDLQKLKLKSWQIFFLTFILASIGFSLGMFLFNFLSHP